MPEGEASFSIERSGCPLTRDDVAKILSDPSMCDEYHHFPYGIQLPSCIHLNGTGFCVFGAKNEDQD